jgi:hypothetical protein
MIKKFIPIIFAVAILLSGCQATTREWGGNMTLTLEPGEKLEEITWKDDSLWYLTRPMREGEEAETHVFKQSSNFGVFEGTVTIIEKEESDG